MTTHLVTFHNIRTVQVPTGTLLTEAARLAGAYIAQPCGGQGRCGRCAVQVIHGSVPRRSTQRLSPDDVAAGYVLACQAVVESNVLIAIPPQEKIRRRLTTDRMAAEVTVPEEYNPATMQSLRRIPVTLTPPTMQDQTDDWSRLQTALRQYTGINTFQASLSLIQRMGVLMRAGDWQVTVLMEIDTWDRPQGPARLIDMWPGLVPDDEPLWGIAVDIGTTTVTLWLVDLISGKVQAQVADYNSQIARGEDVISRVMYASKNNGAEELRTRVLSTITTLLDAACARVQLAPEHVVKATIAGNSIMIHLLLGIPAENIRLTPFVPVVNHIPTLRGHESGLPIHPEASVDCLPGIASYVGADISAGVLSSGLADTESVTLFMDIGTNGEMVLGNREWQVACACSAGPAFEGAGVRHGMRATDGAIEEVWVHGTTYEPTFRVIGDGRPRGICGSGLISLLAELFLVGVIDKSGNVNCDLPTARVRLGSHGGEYVVAWGEETYDGRDIVLTHVDIDNLLRAKAAIYAGFTVLYESIGVPLETVEQVLVGGAFGKYINVEKALEIGLLPDMPWERFHFLGNTAVRGAYLALLDRKARARITEITDHMTYIELSADNTFYEAFTSALFLPHTDLARFPTVQAALVRSET